MPRAKIKKADPVVTARPFRFEPAIEEELVNLLGYDLRSPEQINRRDEAIARTAQASANYLGAAELAPVLPRPAHIHAEIKAFLRNGDFSDEAWRKFHPWTQQTLNRYGASGDAPLGNADDLIDACERYLHSHPVKPSGVVRRPRNWRTTNVKTQQNARPPPQRRDLAHRETL